MKSKKIIYVLVLTLLLSALVGCGGNEESIQSNNPEETNTSQEEPLKDTVVIAQPADVTTLDAQYMGTMYDQNVLINIHDTLVRFDKSGEVVSCLAEKWGVSEDNLTYTFKLKEGVKFHNGEELKASDVVFSLNRAKTSPYLAAQIAIVKDVVATDDYTVEIILNEPYAPGLLVIGGMLILNEKAVTESGEEYSENPVGTGPYKLVRHDIGERVILERFDDYFQGPASIENVEIIAIAEPTTSVIALETGEIDFTYIVPMILRQSIIDNPELVTHEFESINLNYVIMNTEIEPFNNKLVRQAMNYAIDKEAVILVAEEGMAEEADGIFNKHIFGYSENVKGYEYNVDKAKQLLAEAGYPDGFEVTLKTLSGKFEKGTQVVQENLSNIGITAEIEVCEPNTYGQDLMTGNYEMGYMAITLGQDAELYSMCFHSNAIGGFNMSKYNNPKVDNLFDEAKITLDKKERLSLYEELAQLINDEAVIVPLYFPIRVLGGNKDLKISYINISGSVRIADMSWE